LANIPLTLTRKTLPERMAFICYNSSLTTNCLITN
jgi:hypothetical protein